MGHDGRDGVRAVRDHGGMVIAQDEASSTVWGMPGAVVEAGLADRVLPLDRIGSAIADWVASAATRDPRPRATDRGQTPMARV
jgi:two-component system chemotaxis response regulator CheB